MKIFSWPSVKRISLHILFWISFISFYTIIYGLYSGTYIDVFLQSMYTLPIDISVTYFAIYFLIPKFLLQRKYFLYIVTLIVSTLLAGAAERVFNHYIVYPHFYPQYNPSEYSLFTPRFFNMTMSVYTVVILASAIKILKYWIEERHRRMELEIENQSSELALLRNQINPHFLFNTLNNIHTLIQKDSERAADSLMRLSEIMRYMLYESNSTFVPLEYEIEYIRSYVDLQKLRLTNPENVRLEIYSSVNGYQIAPMIFIPFIENAFKHSEKNSDSIPVFISLNADVNPIVFKVSNPIKDKNTGSLDSTGGIGLKNVERRLELLYSKKYQLNISQDNNIYDVTLTLSV